MKWLLDDRIVERDFITFLEYKRIKWIYKVDHDKKMKILIQKIDAKNKAETKKMIDNHNKKLKLKSLELELKGLEEKLRLKKLRNMRS